MDFSSFVVHVYTFYVYCCRLLFSAFPFPFSFSFLFLSVAGNFLLLFFAFCLCCVGLCCRNFLSLVAAGSSAYFVMVVPLKRTAYEAASSSVAVPVTSRRRSRRSEGFFVLPQHVDCGDCTWVCEFCGAFF